MKRNTFKGVKRQLCVLIAFVMTITCTLPASAAEPIGSNVRPTYDEAYYATLDYYGNLLNGSVVKSYTLNGATSLADKGAYDEIINLTDGTAPASQDGGPTFRFGEDAPAHFYFEGKTAAPFEALPWTVSVSYTLNGVPTPAEDLPDKTGVVEIIIDAVPNEAASEYARNNYTLEATAMFNQDDILSLEAEGAQVQLVGNIRAVLFAVLPGETAHRVIRVGTDAFQFDGLTFLMVPATLGQLDEISKLSQRKDDLEEDYRKLSGSLDTLLSSFSALGGSLRETASGLDQLNEARDTISQGKEQIYADGDRILADMDQLNTSLSTLPGHLGNADDAVTDVTGSLNDVSDAAVRLQGNLRDLDDCIKAIQKDLDHIQNHTGDLEENMKQLGQDVDALKKLLDETKTNLGNLDLKINGGILNRIPDDVLENLKLQGMTGIQLKEAISGAAVIQNAWVAADARDGQKQGTLNFMDDQLGVMLATDSSLSPEKATSALELFDAIDHLSPRPTTEAGIWKAFCGLLREQGLSPLSIPVAAGIYTKEYLSYQQKLPTIRAVFECFCGSLDGRMDRPQFFASILMLKDLKALTPEQIAAGGAQAVMARKADYLAAADKLVTLWDTVNKDYDLTPVIGLMSKLSDLLEHIGTKGLAGHLNQLLKEMNNTLGDLNGTADVGRDLLQRMDVILGKLDELNDTINDQVPGLRDTIQDTRTLVSDMVLSVDDTHAFLTSLRTLAKGSGEQLDAGTKKSLENLAETLRRTANSTDAAGGVKTAKDAVSEIVEDTWHEYTGDINNILLMDPHAEVQSLTSPENPAPTSVQILIRTQEIKPDVTEAARIQPVAAAPSTFFGRIGQMFKDFWKSLTGIFH